MMSPENPRARRRATTNCDRASATAKPSQRSSDDAESRDYPTLPATHSPHHHDHSDPVHRAAARRTRRRAETERLIAIAEHLPDADRKLVCAVLDRGCSINSVARAAGVSAHRLRRRYDTILDRMRTPAFRFVAANASRWSTLQRNIAVAVFLNGKSRRTAARETGESYYRVRLEAAKIAALAEAHARATGATFKGKRC